MRRRTSLFEVEPDTGSPLSSFPIDEDVLMEKERVAELLDCSEMDENCVVAVKVIMSVKELV